VRADESRRLLVVPGEAATNTTTTRVLSSSSWSSSSSVGMICRNLRLYRSGVVREFTILFLATRETCSLGSLGRKIWRAGGQTRERAVASRTICQGADAASSTFLTSSSCFNTTEDTQQYRTAAVGKSVVIVGVVVEERTKNKESRSQKSIHRVEKKIRHFFGDGRTASLDQI
jgi:hypothetical protein